METPYVFERILFPSTEATPRNGEGDAVVLSDGSLLLVYGEFCGGGDAAPATLQGVVSRDSGRTWQEKRLVQENDGGRNVMSASLLRTQKGDLLLAYLRKDDDRRRCTPFVKRSADDGMTWSEPKPVTEVTDRYHVVNNDRLVQLRGGRLLLPACVSEGGEMRSDVVFFSEDEGRTWSRSEPRGFLAESKSGPQEPGVIELKDGRIMMWCRSDMGCIYCCHSTDGGERFGPWHPTSLKAPVAPASIKRLPSSEHLLCLFNNHESPPEYWAVTRAPLTAAVSPDEGATWRIAGDLEPDRTKSYCYTSITFLPAGEILLTYYLGRSVDTVEDGKLVRSQRNLSHLKVAVLEERWFLERA